MLANNDGSSFDIIIPDVVTSTFKYALIASKLEGVTVIELIAVAYSEQKLILTQEFKQDIDLQEIFTSFYIEDPQITIYIHFGQETWSLTFNW